jgi:pimeloyl-ACP methyl ester carboxylesterase
MLAFQLPRRAARQVRADDFAALERLYRRWSPSWSFPRDALAEVKRAYGKPGVVEAALAPYVAARKHLRGTLRELRQPIPVPTLALYGLSDPSVPESAYTHASKYFSGGYRFEGVPEVGHFLQREDPAGVAERIINFIQEPST